MKKEDSLLLLKPDCLKRKLVKTVLKQVEHSGMQVIASKKVNLTEADIKEFYTNCYHEYFFNGLSKFMQSGPVMVFIVRGYNAINELTNLVGHRNPVRAKKGTIRSMGINIRYNLAHSSRTYADFVREVNVIWKHKKHN